MFYSNTFLAQGKRGLSRSIEDDHDDLTERLRKTLYYGKLPGTERPSLPLTDIAVEFFQDAAPKPLGKLDTYLASSTARSACMSPTSVTVGMMYVNRLRKRQPDYLTQISSSELFLISMMMASKFLYDEGVDEEVFNDEWAESGDMDTLDVNQLERDFLNAIDWQLFVQPKEFAEMLQLIEKRIALQQGIDRGWFSYTDLYILSHDLKFNWADVTAELSKVMTVSSLAYIAGILTMLGSTVLGLSTSTVLVQLGTSTVPLYLQAQLSQLPSITLPYFISPEIIGSRSIDKLGHRSNMEVNNMSLLNQDDLETIIGLVDRTEDAQIADHATSSESQEVILDSNDLGKPKVTHENRQKQTGKPATSFNGFLSPFLALLALKDTIVKFVSAVGEVSTVTMETTPSNDLTTTTTTEEICSAGPCLVDSWSNCWNVTSDYDWSEFKNNAECCQSKTQCCNGCQTNSNSRLNDKWQGYNNGHDSVNSKLGNRQFEDNGGSHGNRGHLGSVHCCCSATTDSSLLGNGWYSKFPDFVPGFTTTSILPIFVTT